MNPETGKVTKNTEANQLGENETAFSVAEVKELGAVNDVLAKAKRSWRTFSTYFDLEVNQK